MRISIETHTLLRAAERGASESEIMDILRTGKLLPAKNFRSIKYKVYPFHKERNGKYYEEKRIEVVFIEEAETIVTITVYVYYGKWS